MVTERKMIKKVSNLKDFLLSEFAASVDTRGLQYLKLNGKQMEIDRY
jgi:hypothetical protein